MSELSNKTALVAGANDARQITGTFVGANGGTLLEG